MAEAAAKSVLDTISQGHLECPICCCRFTEPKILDCLHSFCLDCLDELISRQQPKADKISCPVCRRETVVPDTGLHSLSNCFFLSSLVDEVNKQEQLLDRTSVDPPTCEECDEGLEAVSRCLDCDGIICLKCQETHEKMKSTKKHRIVELGENKTEMPPTDPRKNETPKCAKHTSYDICYYCDTCQTLACAKCVVTNHRTAEHNFHEMSDAIQLYRQEVDEVLLKLKSSKEQFKVSEDSIEYARNRLRIMVTRVCEDISTKEEEQIAKIKTKSRRLRDKVTQIGEERDQRFKEVLSINHNKRDEAEQIVATVSDLMQQADDFELLNLKPKVMHNLEFQKALEFEHAQHGLSFIDVKCRDVVADSDLGEVLQEEKWKLKCEFRKEGSEEIGAFGCARDVACFSNGDIAVTDASQKQLMIFTSSGRYKAKVPENEEEDKLEAPRCITVICDELLVSDKKNVKVYDSNLKLIRQFSPLQDDAENEPVSQSDNEANLTGVDVSEKNQVAVADRGRKVISIHNLDGSLITSIPNGMIDYDVAISSQAIGSQERLIFTNFKGKKLICTTDTGNEVFGVDTISDGKPVKPFGVCCDDAGDIYISVHGNSAGNGEVHHYSPGGTHIGRVAHGLYHPLRLAFTPCGDLVVADKHSVKIFQRV